MDQRISFITLAVRDLDASRAEQRGWGGCTGYFGDPDGYRWEVAFNPGPIGQVVLP